MTKEELDKEINKVLADQQFRIRITNDSCNIAVDLKVADDIKALISKVIDGYNQWLFENGYTDDDIWAEIPTAPSRFKEKVGL